jgi:sarcosine oxidase subunit alpha
MSHPGELSLSWAVNRKKPFFVGCRSVDIVMAQQQTRKLVGFNLPLGKGKPEEGHLVIKGDEVSGNVTSCEYSPTTGSIIGMAYTGIEESEPGSTLAIRIDGGQMVNATVVELPFFDKDNQRQEL